MNKKLGLLLALLFVGTTIIPAVKKEQPAPKKEKAAREYTLSVTNKLDTEASVTIVDTKDQKHNVSLAAKETKEVAKTTDKTLKIKKIEAKAGDKTATKEFKKATREATVTKSKKGELKIKQAWHKGKKCPSCKEKKRMKAKKAVK